MFSSSNNNTTLLDTAVGNKTSTLSSNNSLMVSSSEFPSSTIKSYNNNSNNNSRNQTTGQPLDDDSPLQLLNKNNNIQLSKPLSEPSSPSSTTQFDFPSPSLLILESANNNLLSPRRASKRLSLASPLLPMMIFNNEQENQTMNNNGNHHSTTLPAIDSTNGNTPKSRWSKLKSAFRRESKQQPSVERLKAFQQQYEDSNQPNNISQFSNRNYSHPMETASQSFATLPSNNNSSSLLQSSSKSSPSLYNTYGVENRESVLTPDSNHAGGHYHHTHSTHAPSGSSSSSSMTNSVNSITSYHQYLQSSSSSGNSIVSPMSSAGVLENPMVTMIMNGDSSRFSPPLSNLIVDNSGRGTSPPSPFSENLVIQTRKERVTSPLSILTLGNEMISKTNLTENYNSNNSNHNCSPFTPPTPNEHSDGTELPTTLQTSRKTKGNIKRLISMLTPRRKKSITSSSLESTTNNTQTTKTSPNNDESITSSDPALLDVANKRKLFEKRSSTESKILSERSPKTPRTNDEQIQRLVNEKIVTSKIQQFTQSEDENIGLSQRKYSVSGKLANWLKSGGSESRLSRSFIDEKKEKRKSAFDFGKREYDLTPTIETPSSQTPTLSSSTNEKLKKLISKYHSANTPCTMNPLSTLAEQSPKEENEEEFIPLTTLSPTPKSLLVPSLNFSDEQFKRTTEDIINGNISSLLSNDSAYSMESSEDTSSSLQVITASSSNIESVDNMRATVTSPSGALSPGCLEYNTAIAPEYEVGDNDVDEESILSTTEYVPLTNYGDVKPKKLYSFVLEKFVSNLNLDDQKCAECFETFITGYLEFCRQSEESKNEELRDYANFSENDIPKMRDFEKPKCFLLHQSAKKNRSSLIFLLVTKYGCSVDAEDELESTPLHWATSHKSIDSILVLCQLGGKINIRDKYGKAPIHLLFAKAFSDEQHHEMDSAKKCFNAAQMMCNMFEGDYNFKTTEGSTVLHMACDQGRMEAVKFLVSESNDINISDSVGTAFASSTQSGNKVLLNSKDKFGKTPLMRAATKGHIAIVEYIITNSKPNVVFGPMSRDERKQNVLHQAALQGLDALVNRIAFLNPSSCATMMQEQDASGNSPLHLAVSKGNIKTVNLFLTLLTKEVVNVVNEKGETPLHLACKVKDKPAAEKICRYLLQNGANPDVKDNKHQTPRMLAAENDLQISFGKKRK